MLKAQGDAKLIVKQVRNQYLMKNHRLRNYRNRVWDEIEGHDAFSIIVVPREKNTKACSMAISASLLLPQPKFENKLYKVEVIFRPNVSDNAMSWQVFKGNRDIQHFLEGP